MNEPFQWRTFIEPISFFIAFSFGLSETVLTDEILIKTCQKELGKNITDCFSLSTFTSVQEIVQPRAATILALKSFIENFIPAIVCIFFGCWCDVMGRKPILLIATTGTVIYYASLALLSYFNVDVYWYLAVSLITSLWGGFPIVIMACYIYAIDIVNYGNQYRRLNFVDLTVLVGKLAGCLMYPMIVKRFRYWVTFATSSAGCLVGLILTGLLLKETLHLKSNVGAGDPWHVKIANAIREFFQWLSLFSRELLGFTLLVVALNDDVMQGTSTTLYLFAQQFRFTLINFSTYTAVSFAATAIGILVLSCKLLSCIPHKKLLAISTGLVSHLGSAFARAFTKSSTHLYTAIGVGAFSWLPMYLNRKDVVDIEVMPKEDFCKGFTATTALERLALSFIIPLNIYLCTNFITTYPHPVWLMQISLQVVAILFICVLFVRDILDMLGDTD